MRQCCSVSSVDIYITPVSVFPTRSLIRHSQTHSVHFLITFRFSYHRACKSYLALLPQLHLNASCAKGRWLFEEQQQYLQKLLILSENTKKATHCVSEAECFPSWGGSAYHVNVVGVSHVQLLSKICVELCANMSSLNNSEALQIPEACCRIIVRANRKPSSQTVTQPITYFPREDHVIVW